MEIGGCFCVVQYRWHHTGTTVRTERSDGPASFEHCYHY